MFLRRWHSDSSQLHTSWLCAFGAVTARPSGMRGMDPWRKCPGLPCLRVSRQDRRLPVSGRSWLTVQRGPLPRSTTGKATGGAAQKHSCLIPGTTTSWLSLCGSTGPELHWAVSPARQSRGHPFPPETQTPGGPSVPLEGFRSPHWPRDPQRRGTLLPQGWKNFQADCANTRATEVC